MKGPDGVSFHSRKPHRQGVSADCEGMKGKVESHQCCILCEGATMQEMLVSDNVGPEDDGNASVSTGEGSWQESNKTGEYRYHRLRCSYDYIGLTEYYQPEISADPYIPPSRTILQLFAKQAKNRILLLNPLL